MRDGLAETLLYACIPLALAAWCGLLLWVFQWGPKGKRALHIRALGQYRLPLAAAISALVLGVGFSVEYAERARQNAYADAQSHFLHLTDQGDIALQDRFDRLTNLLDGVRALLLARPGTTRAEFRDYIAARDPQLALPGVRGLGFIRRMPAAGQAPAPYRIEFLEPQSRNQGTLGYDIGNEPLRRAAADAAMRGARPALTRRISLIQDELNRPAFLLLLPVYDGPVVPEDEAARIAQLRGWVYAPLVLSEWMAGTTDLDAQLSNTQLFDGPQTRAEDLIYDSLLPGGETNVADSMRRPLQSRFSVTRPILLVDQVLYRRTNSTLIFEASYQASEHLKIAVLGASLSLLGAMVLWMTLAGRARALDMARRMTQDLDRLAMVARRSSNAVFFADTDWRITWVNEGFTRLSGYGADEALGCRPSSLLHGPHTDPTASARIDHTLASGQRLQMQLLQQNKAGVEFWVDMEILPLRNRSRQITGYMAVQSDITEEVRAKAALVVEKERAENILTGANVGTWESNLLTGEQRWNDCWGSMMGFGRAEVEPDCDRFWQSRLHPTDQERLNQYLEECRAGLRDGYSCEVRVRRKDGQWMWILSRAKVMSRLGGAVEWLGGIHTDITDIKQVELNLREVESFLDRAGRIASVGAWQIDLATRQVVFSAQTCAIHGMGPDFQPSERVALSFYQPADRRRLRDAVRAAEADGTPWDLVLEFRTAQGEQRWVRIFGEVARDETGPVRLVGAFQDVTSDHLARQEVERSGALLRGAIETINEAFVLYDPQDRLVLCNDKYRAIYARSADMMVPGNSFESIVRAGAERGEYVEALGRVDEWVAERLRAHQAGNVSMEQRLSNGRWLKVIERRMSDGHMVGFRVDITELKLATAAAELTSAKRGEEQRRMQTILEGTHVGTWEWNILTGESIYNDEYVGMLGYALEDLEPLGYDTWAHLVHPDDLVQSTLAMQAHLRGETPGYAMEMRMRHRDGHWIWVLAKGRLAHRTPDGRPLWVYGTHMDITERKHAEQQLAQTTATLQNVLDSATAVGIVTLGRLGQVRIFNKGAENLLGYAAEEVVGQHSAERFFDPAELGVLRETLELAWGERPQNAQVLAHLVTIREAQEWTLVRKDGSRFKASMIFSPMHDVQGDLVGNLGVIYDISRQKEYESSLRDAMHLAEQSSVAKSQFLANMSHEIRTPMNAILGMLQLLRNTALDNSQRDYADKAVGAARSLLGLLNDILDFSKVEAGKMQLNPEPFRVEDLLDDLAVILSSNLGGKAVDLRFDLDPDLPLELLGDAMRLKQILINLGGNAVKFTERGEVVIRWAMLARTPERVRIAIAVEDTGIGIAPENQARIFSAFTQAEANTTRRFGGTGLGLVISTRLIRLMGGELELHSVLGQGSRFSFTLECNVVESAAAAQARLAAQPITERVLLVDDNLAALSSAARMLRSLGWQVQEAASGEQALAWLADQQSAGAVPPDALFVDVDMPGMDGWETLRLVQQLYQAGPVPLRIALSRQDGDTLHAGGMATQRLVDALAIRPLTRAMFVRALAQARGGLALAAQQSAPVSRRRLAGMRLLVVEDNAINQQVAQELLSAEGAQVTLADNGASGVEALRQSDPLFDAVLMDLQMPVMDGLSATRLLRTDPRLAQVPVIAMTANAMLSDRAECLAAGMNDHIGKPFDLNQLVATLRMHTGWQTPSTDARAPDAVPASATAAPTPRWPDGIDVDAALGRMGGNQRLLQRAIQGFLADAQALPLHLAQAAQAQDPAGLQRELHSFKGLCGTLGVATLARHAARVEQLLRAGAVAPAWPAAVAQLAAQLAHFVPLLSQVAEQLHGPDARTPTGTEGGGDLRPQWQALLAALQAGDMEALALYAQLRQACDAAMVEGLEPLDLAMADLEFGQAALACAALLETWDRNEQ